MSDDDLPSADEPYSPDEETKKRLLLQQQAAELSRREDRPDSEESSGPALTPSSSARSLERMLAAATRRRLRLIVGGAAVFLVLQIVFAFIIITMMKKTPGDPGHETEDLLALYGKASSLAKEGKYLEAQEALDRLQGATKDVLDRARSLQQRIRAETQVDLARRLISQHQWGAARLHLEQALRLAPDHQAAILLMEQARRKQPVEQVKVVSPYDEPAKKRKPKNDPK